MKNLDKLFDEHIKWAKETFPLATSKSCLIHAEKEIKEIVEELNKLEPISLQDYLLHKEIKTKEYADAIGCILDSMMREGISIDNFKKSFSDKLEINKKRKWKLNDDLTYSHIK